LHAREKEIGLVAEGMYGDKVTLNYDDNDYLNDPLIMKLADMLVH
jgi:hypothetical protein